MIDINSLTVGEAKQIASMFVTAGETSGKTHSIPLGKAVLIRTVTHYYTGRITAITDSDIVLADAAWIASTGRFSAALTTGALDEVEPFPDGVTINRAGVIDISPWNHELPRDAK